MLYLIFSSGTFPFIYAEGSIQDGFAQCLVGFLSVVVKEMQWGIECVDNGVLQTSTKSGGYTSQVAGNGRGGSVHIGDLCADEVRGFLFTLGLGLVAVQYRPPWPPPSQLEMLSDGVHRRPIPWPSFSCSVKQGLMMSIHYEFSLQCWKDFIEEVQLKSISCISLMLVLFFGRPSAALELTSSPSYCYSRVRIMIQTLFLN
jgi:hypothetical protein